MADGFSANYGFDGIVVALLARNSPAGCIPAALLFAALRQGGGLMEARVDVSSSLVLSSRGSSSCSLRARPSCSPGSVAAEAG